MSEFPPHPLPESVRRIEARPLDERAAGYLDVLEQLRRQLEDPSPE